MFRLWVFIPFRQRNMREMKLGDNLYHDAESKWRLTFRGDELKVGTKRGRINSFDQHFPEDLVPVLEEYLKIWRPILLSLSPHPHQERHLFLTNRGTPHERRNLTATTSRIIYRYTGKHWHPHIIRTVWATEYIRNTHGDFYTASVMLNDRMETVIANYTHLLEEDVAEKAYRIIAERLRQGK